MTKEIILKNLLTSLLENRLSKLEKRQIEEIKDLKIIKANYSNQEEILKSLKIIKKIEPKKKLLIKQKTNNSKISTLKKNSARLHTPLNKQTHSKSKDNNYNKKDNFTNLNKNKIDGNYRTKTKKNTIDNIKNNDNQSFRIRKYKTPIRKIYHSNLNSEKITKDKKDLIHEPKTPSTSFYKDKSNKPYKHGSKITSSKLIDSINRANKSYNIENLNNLNKSNHNLTNTNLYINDITYNDKNKNQELGIFQKSIKININKKNKSNLMLEKYVGKEAMKSKNKKDQFVLNNNFGEWLCSEEGREILISISNYLDIKTKYNLFSCQKKYIKNLYNIIEDLYTEFKENNKINPNSNIIEEKINEIKEKYSPNELNINNTHFILSKSCLKALELLNDEEHEKFFNNSNFHLFSDDIYIVYKIIFQLIKNNEVKNAENKKEFYEKMGNFVHKYINDKNQIGDFFKKMANEFEFNEENIFQIRKIIKGKEEKLKPRNYSQICATTGLVIFLVKDILEYLGLNYNSNKGKPVFILMNLEFLEKVKTKLPKYLKFLKSLIKN